MNNLINAASQLGFKNDDLRGDVLQGEGMSSKEMLRNLALQMKGGHVRI